MDIQMLRERARIIRQVRSFFDLRDYLETDTPLLAPSLIPESCLEVFQTLRLPPAGSRHEERPYWLIPSPEIWMKRLIAQHRTSLYQICKCFRNGESSGRQHSPEFTMLEYYTVGADYRDSLEITEELLSFLLKGTDSPPEISPPFIQLTVEEAFEEWAGFSLFQAARTPGAMEDQARRLGLDPPPGLSDPGLYDLIFIHAVEPRINLARPVALTEYPAFVPCLAKKSGDGKTVERWELYARGVELANCFTEETSALQVRLFFESEKAEKERTALVRHAVDSGYWKIFDTDSPFPPCSGVAMGLDRLIMVLCGRKTLDGVLPFPME
ncbi:MAG: LysR family transcriptional regulator [Treponema sp.]|nr:LysR family transcriptional regulator [Treponema sp.]